MIRITPEGEARMRELQREDMRLLQDTVSPLVNFALREQVNRIHALLPKVEQEPTVIPDSTPAVASPERSPSVPETPRFGGATRVLHTTIPMPKMRQSPEVISKNALTTGIVSGAVSGTVVGSVAAIAPLVTGAGAATTSLVVVPAAALAGLQGIVAGAAVYLSGCVHNMLWRKDGVPEPGRFGTVLRGIISPVSIPAGIIKNIIAPSR